MRKNALVVIALSLLAAACNPPRYAAYESLQKDYRVSVPWGWRVVTDAQSDGFSEAVFIGPLDADFYLGAPSLSVRWYGHRRLRKLGNGGLEIYTDPDDFIRQMLTEVYGPDSVLLGPDKKVIPAPVSLPLKGSGMTARYFVVLSPTPAPANRAYGVSETEGGPGVLRKHAYAIVPMDRGFYVLCYPATHRGYDRYEQLFRGLIGSFVPLTDGPGGEKVKVRPLGS